MGFKVVLSEKEASSKAFDVLPRGWYKVTISDVDLKESKSAKNKGKPYYAIEFTVNAPEKYEGRKVFTNVMLFEGALYSLNQLLNARGIDTTAGEVEVPDADELLGQELMVRLSIKPAESGTNDDGSAYSYDERNEVKAMKAIDDETMAKVGSATSKSGGSLLPS